MENGKILREKTALVTGANSGIGAEVARAMGAAEQMRRSITSPARKRRPR